MSRISYIKGARVKQPATHDGVKQPASFDDVEQPASHDGRVWRGTRRGDEQRLLFRAARCLQGTILTAAAARPPSAGSLAHGGR
jgi:hypothetical protein